MKSGRELDKIIAIEVMELENVRTQEQGYHHDLVYGPNGLGGVACLVPNYSTDISDAWEVFDKFHLNNLTRGVNGWICRIGITSFDKYIGATKIIQIEKRAETAPLAICLAALETLEVRKK